MGYVWFLFSLARNAKILLCSSQSIHLYHDEQRRKDRWQKVHHFVSVTRLHHEHGLEEYIIQNKIHVLIYNNIRDIVSVFISEKPKHHWIDRTREKLIFCVLVHRQSFCLYSTLLYLLSCSKINDAHILNTQANCTIRITIISIYFFC